MTSLHFIVHYQQGTCASVVVQSNSLRITKESQSYDTEERGAVRIRPRSVHLLIYSGTGHDPLCILSLKELAFWKT